MLDYHGKNACLEILPVSKYLVNCNAYVISFPLVSLSFVSLICRASAIKCKRMKFFLPYNTNTTSHRGVRGKEGVKKKRGLVKSKSIPQEISAHTSPSPWLSGGGLRLKYSAKSGLYRDGATWCIITQRQNSVLKRSLSTTVPNLENSYVWYSTVK